MSWRVIDQTTIYHEQGMYVLCPNAARTPASDLLVTFLRAPHIGHAHHCNPLFEVQVRRSTDEGQTWSEPRLLANNQLGGVNNTFNIFGPSTKEVASEVVREFQISQFLATR